MYYEMITGKIYTDANNKYCCEESLLLLFNIFAVLVFSVLVLDAGDVMTPMNL